MKATISMELVGEQSEMEKTEQRFGIYRITRREVHWIKLTFMEQLGEKERKETLWDSWQRRKP